MVSTHPLPEPHGFYLALVLANLLNLITWLQANDNLKSVENNALILRWDHLVAQDASKVIFGC